MEKIILHIDMNSYFASVEQQANPFLRGKAIGVTGKRTERSVVAAASREAKKLGVRTAMSTWEAKRVLPSMILVMGDPEKYSDITRRFNAIFFEFTHLVERFSVDESFLDITDSARDFLGATIIAQTIKTRLREECGGYVTCSVGIASNKPMAKLASDRMKPDGLVVVLPGRETELLDASRLEDVCGIGPRMAVRLNALGIFSFPQLRAYPLDRLVGEFKSYALRLHDIAHGRGDATVSPGEVDPKSVGHSYTLPTNVKDPPVIRRYLLTLCDKVAWRLRRDGFATRCVTAYVRYGDFSGECLPFFPRSTPCKRVMATAPGLAPHSFAQTFSPARAASDTTMSSEIKMTEFLHSSFCIPHFALHSNSPSSTCRDGSGFPSFDSTVTTICVYASYFPAPESVEADHSSTHSPTSFVTKSPTEK